MRISNIQNFAANAVNMMDKCCSPRKFAKNNLAQNNLERSPAMDTVSFGNFGVGGKNTHDDPMVEAYIGRLLPDYDLRDYFSIGDCIYLDVTVKDLMKNIYKADLVSFERFCPDADKDSIKEHNKILKDIYDDFNEENGYEKGWEKHLHTEEDFRKLAELARCLDLRAYHFVSDEEERPMFRNW